MIRSDHWFYKAQHGLIYSGITALLEYPTACPFEILFSVCVSPEVDKRLDVNLQQLQKHSHSEMAAVRTFHCSLIESLLRPNQQVCSSLVSGFLPYPQGLWNGGQWVCYCFSLPLYPHIALWCQRWSDKWGEKKKPREEITAFVISVCFYSQQGYNCSSGHGCVPIWRMERGKYHLSPNRLKWNSSSWQRAAENIEFSLKFITKHNPRCLSDGVHFTGSSQKNDLIFKQYCQCAICKCCACISQQGCHTLPIINIYWSRAYTGFHTFSFS